VVVVVRSVVVTGGSPPHADKAIVAASIPAVSRMRPDV
jgi:hypothetical protein